MKAIGAFVLVLLVGLGVAMYVVTRPPNRELDAQGRAWVQKYEIWADATGRRIDCAVIGMTLSSEAKNARLIEPLRRCSASFARLGEPPALLRPVQEVVQDACGEAQYAAQVNDEFGTSSLATVQLHLNEAEDRLVLARRTLRTQLGQEEPGE